MELRPHQIKAVEMLRASIFEGKHRPILAAPCSFGKTITAAYMLKGAAEKGKRGIFLCDRIKLVQQAVEQFDLHGLEVGVIQGMNDRQNIFAPIQIASIQTLARRERMPEFDFAIVDEAHVHYRTVTRLMESYNAVPFIGLTATPFSKGLGKHYNNLVIPITTEELLDQGYLTPIHYYGGEKPDLSGIRKKSLPTGGSDYDVDGLAEVYEKNHKLCGDIIKNWLRFADGYPTIAFSPSIKHSKFMVDLFNEAGIPAEHIDGYMEPEERQWLFDAHEAGEFKVLSCSRLLNVGYDAPYIKCLIDAFPTTSKITFVQRAGRILRLADNKDFAVYLDHAGNVGRHGFAEQIVPESLDDGEKRYSEASLLKEKEEPKVKECPECYQQMVGVRCKACGYEIPMKKRIEHDGSMLQRLNAAQKANKVYSNERKGEILGELYYYAHTRGFSEGWAHHKYKAKFGVWPNKIKPILASHVSDEVNNLIRRENIRFAYAQGKVKKNDSTSNIKQTA